MASDRAYPVDELGARDPHVPRETPCAKRTWCLLAELHEGNCVEVARGKLPASDFGPERAKAMRW